MKGPLDNLPELKRRERPFEYRLRDELKKRDVMFIKLKPTIRSIPDRLAIGFMAMIFVECKSRDGDLDEGQKEMHAKLRKKGHKVVVVKGDDVAENATLIVKALRKRR